MRTTLDIDDDVLTFARERAKLDKKTVGEVISQLARAALRPVAAAPASRNGLPTLPAASGARPVTLELVNQLRDELPQ